MQITLKFEGIDCASCASKLENKLNKIKGVEANISFIAGKILLNLETEELLEVVKKTCYKVEPDIKLSL
jgi:copper chaperone CopZ